MRLLIDLDSGRDDAANAAALALARGAAATHAITIVVADIDGAAVDAVRLAFAGLPLQLRSYALPAVSSGAAAQWRAPAAALVRRQFLATLAPDLVLAADPLAVASDAYASAPLAGFDAAALAAADAAARAAPRVSASASASATPAATEAAPPAAAPATTTAAARPRLAYISPLPPEHSGIADYSAELVPELARFYDIELIVDQPLVDDARLAAWTPRSVAWFEANADQFERVLYHFGNSGVHQHMFSLIRRHPGIVVLHDFFFSGILDNVERDGYLPEAFLAALYESHGYSGLLDHAQLGRNPSIWKYPLNKGVLDNASGVIVHADFSRRLAEQWYGAGAADGWHTVPLLRGRAPGAERAAARARLGLLDDAYLVCSFGMLGRTKLNAELLDAFLASPLAADPRCTLLFVGENDGGPYGEALAAAIAAHTAGGGARVAITGFVAAPDYADHLAACDCAVQLRAATRGETSASVLDCLLYGVPTIINAHGAAADIDDALLVKLPDAVDVAGLAQALARLRADPALRAELGARAAAHLRAGHAPARVGRRVADAIEQITAHGAHGHYRRLIDDLVRIAPPATASIAELVDAAEAIALNQPARAPRQLLVDVSAVVQSDIKTGIQRVVRSVLLALIAAPPPGYRIEPVYSTGSNRPYHYARRFALGMLGQAGLTLEDAPVALRPGDVFLGLDLFTNGTAQNAELLARMRARGVAIHFCVYDILPMLRPGMFPFGTEQYFGDFLHTVAKVADGVVCISRAVADELAGWLAREAAPRAAPLQLGWFHLGADIDASAPSFGLPDNAEQVFGAVAARPSFLMVGTVEPRKGHAQALAAFELLWAGGAQINLVIVGKQGWMVDKLVERMAAHPEREARLFWLAGASDEMLLRLYGSVAALLAPSEGEGFGLPLIEAAQHGVPIIARGLPVFREVAGVHAHYFEGLEPGALADAVTAWLALDAAGAAPPSTALPWLSWRDSADQLVAAVLGQQWYRRHPGG
jgi:glycosyltransferase involved in cell wall biosynthesis